MRVAVQRNPQFTAHFSRFRIKMQGWPLTARPPWKWVSKEPRALASNLRSAGGRRVIQPAHRAPPSHRLLRRAPSGLQLQHAGGRKASAVRASMRGAGDALRTRHRSARDADRGGNDRRGERERLERRERLYGEAGPGRGHYVDEVHRFCRWRRIGRSSTHCCTPTSIGRAIRCSIVPKPSSLSWEHEAMHQETLLYMWHRLPFAEKAQACRLRAARDRRVAARLRRSRFPPACATLGVARGTNRFGWDNEHPGHERSTCRRSPSIATT